MIVASEWGDVFALSRSLGDQERAEKAWGSDSELRRWSIHKKRSQLLKEFKELRPFQWINSWKFTTQISTENVSMFVKSLLSQGPKYISQKSNRKNVDFS
jgi:hypothetical protein